MVAGPGSLLAWLHFVAWPQSQAWGRAIICLSVMAGTLLDAAFEHHVWATLRLIDACLRLTPEQLDAEIPGTYGSIRETMRHLVGADSYYLSHLTGRPEIDTDHMGLVELREVMEADRDTWREILARDPRPDAMVRDVDRDGCARDAPLGVRLAQAIHHGTDHRSQVCSVLTTLGVDPPDIDVWEFGTQTGRVVETGA